MQTYNAQVEETAFKLHAKNGSSKGKANDTAKVIAKGTAKGASKGTAKGTSKGTRKSKGTSKGAVNVGSKTIVKPQKSRYQFPPCIVAAWPVSNCALTQ